MAEDKRSEGPALAGFYEDIERTDTEKIISKILAGLSKYSKCSDDFDVDSSADDAEDRASRPSHVVFGKSTVKKGQIETTKGKYFHDISIVRVRGENNVPLPEADKVVVFRSFLKARLQFSLHRMLVEVQKRFEIFLHQLTPEALVKIGVFN